MKNISTIVIFLLSLNANYLLATELSQQRKIEITIFHDSDYEKLAKMSSLTALTIHAEKLDFKKLKLNIKY